jgi:hypothetical protein
MEVTNKFKGDSIRCATLDDDVYPVQSRLEIYHWKGEDKELLCAQSSSIKTVILNNMDCDKLLNHCNSQPGEYVIIRHRCPGRVPYEDVIRIKNVQMARILKNMDVFFDQKFKMRRHQNGLHVNYLMNTQTAPYDINLII